MLVRVDTRPCKVGNFSWSEMDLKPSPKLRLGVLAVQGSPTLFIVEDDILSLGHGLQDSLDTLI